MRSFVIYNIHILGRTGKAARPCGNASWKWKSDGHIILKAYWLNFGKYMTFFKNMFQQFFCHLQFWFIQSTKLNLKCNLLTLFCFYCLFCPISMSKHVFKKCHILSEIQSIGFNDIYFLKFVTYLLLSRPTGWVRPGRRGKCLIMT